MKVVAWCVTVCLVHRSVPATWRPVHSVHKCRVIDDTSCYRTVVAVVGDGAAAAADATVVAMPKCRWCHTRQHTD